MMNLKRTGPGPDGLPYWLWRVTHHKLSYLTTILTRTDNEFLIKTAECPYLLKLAKTYQLRPISLRKIIMRMFEKLVFKQEINIQSKSIIGQDQLRQA